MHWFGNFMVGAKAVILKGIEPRWILEAISEEQVTVVWLLVPWALDLLFAIESGDLKLKNYSLDQWRLMHIGAQPVPPSLIKEWMKIFPHHQYDTNYGLTESTGPGCVHLGMENMHKVGAVGLPGFDWEHKIVDSRLNPVPKGEPGELLVKGPASSTAPTRTKRKIKNMRVGHSISFSMRCNRSTFLVKSAIVNRMLAPVMAAMLTSMCQ